MTRWMIALLLACGLVGFTGCEEKSETEKLQDDAESAIDDANDRAEELEDEADDLPEGAEDLQEDLQEGAEDLRDDGRFRSARHIGSAECGLRQLAERQIGQSGRELRGLESMRHETSWGQSGPPR